MKHDIEGEITCKNCGKIFEVFWRDYHSNAEYHGWDEDIVCPYCNSVYATVHVCKNEDVYVRKIK